MRNLLRLLRNWKVKRELKRIEELKNIKFKLTWSRYFARDGQW